MRYLLFALILFMAACSDDAKPTTKQQAEVFTVTNLKSAEDALNKINANMDVGFHATQQQVADLGKQLASASATTKMLNYVALGFALACLAIGFYLKNGASLCGSIFVLSGTISGISMPYIIPLVLIATELLVVFTFVTLIYRIEQDLGHVKFLADLKQHIESSIKQLATTAETDAKKLLLAIHDKISPSR